MQLLDCNDASLRLWRDGQDTWSPGFVRFSDGRYQFGELAWQQARRAPREINNRYWHRLSTQDLSPALGPARHTADLVHAHLEALLGDVGGELTLVIPGAMESPQLSLLLGILQTLPVNISAVAHRSALVGGATGQSCAHVELQLHQTCITSVSVERGAACAGETQILPGHGLLGLMDDIAERIGEQFVAQTRFDPQRRAETEQTLYEQIPNLLQSLATLSEMSLTVEGHTARITTDALRPAGAAFSNALAPLLPQHISHIALDTLLSVLPGLSLPCDTSTVETQVIPAVASMMTAPEGELTFQREAPCLEDSRPPAESPAPGSSAATPAGQVEAPPVATHQLAAGRATPLIIGTRIADGVMVSGHGEITIAADLSVHLNDQPADGVITVNASDRLNVGGVEMHFIAVES